MNDDTKTNRERAPRRLRLVSSRPQATLALLPGSYHIRFIPTRRPDAPTKTAVSGQPRRTVMSIIDRSIETVGRFAVGLGTALALVCAFVIVETDPEKGGATVAATAEVVRLDPVVVTISANRYAELQAMSAAPPGAAEG